MPATRMRQAEGRTHRLMCHPSPAGGGSGEPSHAIPGMCASQPAASAALSACNNTNTAGHVKKSTRNSPRQQAIAPRRGQSHARSSRVPLPNPLPQPASSTPHPLAALCQRPLSRISVTESPILDVLPSLYLQFPHLLSQKGLRGRHCTHAEATSVPAAPYPPGRPPSLAPTPYHLGPRGVSAHPSSPKRSSQLPN
jgi:hypothetical protein